MYLLIDLLIDFNGVSTYQKFGLVLRYINYCGLFNVKSGLFIHIRSIGFVIISNNTIKNQTFFTHSSMINHFYFK